MSRTKRLAAAVILAVVAALTAAAVGTSPAFADSTLCSGSAYSTCTGIGYTDHAFGAHYTSSYWRAYAGHNCTNYVAYVESTVNGAPTQGYLLGNGSDWDNNAAAHGVAVDGNKGLGAVAQWEVSSSRLSGHVAYVESVNSDGSITISQDVYNAGPFSWQTIMPGSANWPNHFIHFKDLQQTGGGHYQPVAADFNGDHLADIGLRDANNGYFYIKHGTGFNDQTVYPWAAGTNYQPFAADFNNDGLADIGLRDTATGIFFIKHGPSFNDQVSYAWAAGANYQAFAADFNGDGIADIGLRDSSNGNIFIKHGPSFNDQIMYPWAAGANYQVYAADFNGDRVADIGLRDTATGIFFIKHGPSFNDQISYAWAAGTNYQSFAADFNNDGHADIGLRDISIGMFYMRHGTGFYDQISYQWAAG